MRFIMLRLVLLLVTLCAVSNANSSDFVKDIIQVDHLQRSYTLYIPNKTSSLGRPLIILLHGHGGDADGLLGENGKKAPYKVWLEIADRENLVLVVPNGTVGPSGKTAWNDCRKDASNNSTSNDIAFINTLIDHVALKIKIDQSRIYATGTSNGGHMSIRLALELSERINAVAPVVAAMPKNNKCTSSNHPVPILFMIGTEDPILPYQGGFNWQES